MDAQTAVPLSRSLVVSRSIDKLNRPRRSYRFHAVISPLHGAGLVGISCLAAYSPWMAAIGALPLLELVVWTLMPRLSVFRRVVDHVHAADQRQQRAELREALLAEVSVEHRQELERLEVVRAVVLKTLEASGAWSILDNLPVDALLSRYYRLASAHAEHTALLRLAAPDIEADGASPLRLVRRRQRARCEAARRAMVDEMQRIAELLELVLETVSLPSTGEDDDDIVSRALEELEWLRPVLGTLATARAETAEAGWSYLAMPDVVALPASRGDD